MTLYLIHQRINHQLGTSKLIGIFDSLEAARATQAALKEQETFITRAALNRVLDSHDEVAHEASV